MILFFVISILFFVVFLTLCFYVHIISFPWRGGDVSQGNLASNSPKRKIHLSTRMVALYDCELSDALRSHLTIYYDSYNESSLMNHNIRTHPDLILLHPDFILIHPEYRVFKAAFRPDSITYTNYRINNRPKTLLPFLSC